MGGIKTIGWGHAYWTGPDKITQIEADNLLKKDIIKFELSVDKFTPKYAWTQNEFDALVSFAYNVGGIKQLTNNGTRSKGVIADKMLEYNKMAGKYVEGLYKRRVEERELFLASDYIPVRIEDIANEVISGKWGNGEDRKKRLTEAGYDYSAVQNKVNQILKGGIDLEDIANEVISGKWGNGEDRKKRLTEAGYDYKTVQSTVNKKLKS